MWTSYPDPGPSLWTCHELLVIGPSRLWLPASAITSESDPHKEATRGWDSEGLCPELFNNVARIPQPSTLHPPSPRCVSVHWKVHG